MNEPMSDDDFVRELEHWGKCEDSQPVYSLQGLNRFAGEQRRIATRRILLGVTGFATAIIAMVSLTNLQRQTPTKSDVAMTMTDSPHSTQPEVDPQQLLQSITNRFNSIEARIESLKLFNEEKNQMLSEIDALNASILVHKRIEIQNRIALTSTP